MYWYSMFLLLDRIERTGKGDKFDIFDSSSRIYGMQYYFLSSGLTKYLRAWIHRLTSSTPCYLQRSIMSLSLFLAMQKLSRSSRIPNFLQRVIIPSSKSYILNSESKTLLSGFFVVLCKFSRIFPANSSFLEGDYFIISR